jgi:hypothetical protein
LGKSAYMIMCSLIIEFIRKLPSLSLKRLSLSLSIE